MIGFKQYLTAPHAAASISDHGYGYMLRIYTHQGKLLAQHFRGSAEECRTLGNALLAQVQPNGTV